MSKQFHQVQNKLHSTREQEKDSYIVLYKYCPGKIKINSKQYINIEQVNCTVCFDKTLADIKKDTILNLHPAFGNGFIVAKLFIRIEKRKVDITSIEKIFFKELYDLLKKTDLDHNVLKFLLDVSKTIDQFSLDFIYGNIIKGNNDSVNIFFEVPFELAIDYYFKCDKIGEVRK